MGGEGDVKHYDRPVFLPSSLDSYDGNHVTSPGRPGIPAFVPSWSQTDEKTFLEGLLKDLNENLLAGLDPNPNLSRSKQKPLMYPAMRSGTVERIVFVGGSNAKNLSQAASMLGIDAYMIASGGWKLSRENVEKLIPDLHELMSGLPPGTPIVLFCLDNTSFLAATEEGGMVPISKCVTGDQGYHVNGALVVAPERALQISVEQLKRIVDEFSEFDLFIVTPVTRYVSRPCCKNSAHVSNFGDPDFLANIISDLTKLKFQLRKKLQPATVLDGIELVCGAGCGREKVEQIQTAGWASDPVHPASHVYAKMALNLIEKVASPPAKADSRKRKRSEDSGSGTGAGSQSGSGQANPCFGHHSGQSWEGSRNPRDGMQQPSIYGTGSGSRYASTGYVGNRNYTPSQHSNQSRGRAGSVSSRGTTGMCASTAVKATRDTAAAAAVEGAGAEALETGACPGGSTGRGGKKPPPQQTSL
jgi:hypothetical protein